MASKKQGKQTQVPVKKAAPAKKAPAKKAPARLAAPAVKQAAAKPAPQKAVAKGSGARLGAGDRAPAFKLDDADGGSVSSAELAGKPYVLYFYPKDDTPGCTKEACSFRDSFGAFARLGVRVLGVSPDTSKSHARFRDKYALNFTLLSDAERVLAGAYDTWVKKQNYGREYMGIERSTFLVGSDGVIRRAWRGVRVPGHVEDVLAAL